MSTFGTYIAFEAFPLIAIILLHANPGEVSALAATGRVAGAVLALPLGPWVEYRQKRPVMIAMDLIRCAALLSIPLAFMADWLSGATPCRIGYRRCSKHCIQGGKRCMPESACAARRTACCEWPT
jgi:MFS family permease